jgi:hypothetical protein
MHDAFDLRSLPDQLTLPAIAGFPPLVPMVAFPPAIGAPRSIAALDAGREGGLLAWIPKRDPGGGATPDNLLAVGVLCQVGQSFEDDAGNPRTVLQPIARCTWSDLVDTDDAPHAIVTVQPFGLQAVRDPDLEPRAVGLILQALLGEDDDLQSLLATATKDAGALADEVFFHLFLSSKPDDVLFDLYLEPDPRRRFEGVCELVGVEPVELPDPPALAEVRTRAEAMLAGEEPPDVAALMEDFFPQVLDPDGSVPLEMVLALGRVLALAG